jgi:hypothetical protein
MGDEPNGYAWRGEWSKTVIVRSSSDRTIALNVAARPRMLKGARPGNVIE